MIKAAVLIVSIFAQIPCEDAAVMEAMIQIDSDNFRMNSFLERFKRFIARSHSESSIEHDENHWLHKFVHHNDTFQANYDFSRNLLTMASSYSLLLNGTEQKISDVKITINFKFNQETNERLIFEDVNSENIIPRIDHEKSRLYDGQWLSVHNEESRSSTNESTVLSYLLSPIVNVVEPIIVAFIHIIVNGVLGHVLTTAFDHFYNGRLITV